MELSIKPYNKNSYPKRGVLIKSALPMVWLAQIQRMGLALQDIITYPVPGAKANEVYGCLVVLKEHTATVELNNNALLQLVNNKIFIPEYSTLSPQLSETEWQKVFSSNYYIYHPEIGLAELDEPIIWQHLITLPEPVSLHITAPLKGVAVPRQISTMYIEADPEALTAAVEKPFGDEGLDNLPFDVQKLLKGNQKEMDKFLAFLDKHPDLALKFAIPLDTLGTMRGNNKGKFTFGKSAGGGLGLGLSKVLGLTRDTTGQLTKSSKRSLLLIAMLLTGLVAVIMSASGREGKPNVFPMLIFIIAIALIERFSGSKNAQPRSSSGSGGSNVLLDNERFTTLQKRYENMAANYIAQGQYQKAAHIYLKLLKNYPKAAQVLEDGSCYAEAASIYLNYCKNKVKAAECYEKAKIYNEAIILYKEMKHHEKVGDLYALLNRKEDANSYYNLVADDYKHKSQFVKASLIYKYKIGEPALAQGILLKGWFMYKDPYNCLNNYFANIETDAALEDEINSIYKQTNSKNRLIFLEVIKVEYTKHDSLKEPIKDIAYEIIAEHLEASPAVASELMFFNKEDKSITKDVMKYKAKRRTVQQ